MKAKLLALSAAYVFLAIGADATAEPIRDMGGQSGSVPLPSATISQSGAVIAAEKKKDKDWDEAADEAKPSSLEPVNGIGGTGGGRYTFKPSSK